MNNEGDSAVADAALEHGKNLALIGYAFMAATVLFAPLFVGTLVIVFSKRAQFEGTYVYSHFAWQLETLKYVCLGMCVFFVSALLLFILSLVFSAGIWLGAVLLALMIGVFIWYFYRVAVGVYRLLKREHPEPISDVMT